MRRIALRLVATLAVVLMMAMSTAVALAGWDYEDCPPYAQAAKDHMSSTAFAKVAPITPPAAEPAWKIPAN